MKLMLCVPNQRVQLDGMKARPAISPPVGLLSIAAYLRESQWRGSIQIYDARMSADIRNEGKQWIFGDTDEQMEARIRAANPDVIGISNMFTAQIERAYHFADLAKRIAPDAIVVIGGPHVSVFPIEALMRPSIDYVVVGEGEERLTQLLIALQQGENNPHLPGVIGEPEDLKLLRSNPRAPVSFIDPLD